MTFSFMQMIVVVENYIRDKLYEGCHRKFGSSLCLISFDIKQVWESKEVISSKYCNMRGPGSSVGIATDYGLDGPGSKPVGDEIFRPPDRPWGRPSLL